jgi:hypothetical protein
MQSATMTPGRLRTRLVIVLVCGLLLPAATAFLYVVPPSEGSVYPRCLFHDVTGLHCPGCGTTRCLHALLHGDLRQALAYNSLLVMGLPFLSWCGWRFVRQGWTGQSDGRRLSKRLLWFILIVIVMYGVLRNLPIAPLDLLSPHAL